jgi:hypothetical protein
MEELTRDIKTAAGIPQDEPLEAEATMGNPEAGVIEGMCYRLVRSAGEARQLCPEARTFLTDNTPDEPIVARNFLTDSTPVTSGADSPVPDAQPLSETTSQQAAEAKEQAERVQRVADHPPEPRRDFLTDSTPEISTQSPEESTSAGDSQNSVTESPYLVTRVGYEGRVLPVGYTEEWGAEEIHQSARILFGIPVAQATTIHMVDQCAQSETEPNWLLKKAEPETNEKLLDWMSAPAGVAQWGLEAARMRATVAEQERQRLEQGTAHAARIRARARGGAVGYVRPRHRHQHAMDDTECWI